MGHPASQPDPGVLAAGEYAGGRLITVLRQLVSDGASGLLTVEPDGGEFEEADLLFIGGQLRAVRFAAVTGAPALTRVLVLGGGRWRLEHCSDPPPQNFNGDTGPILDQVESVLRDCDLAAALGVETPAPLDAADLAAAIDEAATKGVNTATFTRTARVGTVAIGTATMAVGTSYHMPQPGDLLGRYRLIRQIGHGASSLVYLAHHTTMDVDVVVKVLLPAALHDGGSSADGPSAAAMTANEARILARLNHPNVMRVFDFDDQGEHPYLVMEYIAGRSLLAMIREQSRLPSDRALTVIRQVARGLALAHHQIGLIHNDLKPANILVAEDGSAKLADFALASMRTVRGDQRGTTTSLKKSLKGPQVMGTPAYVAPEAVRAGMAEPGVTIDHRADIYALGATLYHALTGRTLFSHPDAAKLMLMHVHDTWTPAEHLVPDLDPQVGAVLDRMLAKRVEDRYQTWGELVADLDRLSGKGAGRRTSFFKTMVGKVWKVA
jgi:tRNA A-37 threonylcarbamoyl transferase component Bud32